MNDIQGNASRFLITLPLGIGDAVLFGLSAVDQIIKNDPDAYGKIDILCYPAQAEVFEHDPRIHRVIQVDLALFPTPEPGTWLRVLFLPPATAAVIRSLREQHYEAVFPSFFAPIFYYRLHTPMMNPSALGLIKDILAVRKDAEIHISTVARKFVNRYFGDKLPAPASDEETVLYICPEHVERARLAVKRIKEMASVPQETSKLLVVVPDSSSVITRPPTKLLVKGIAEALKRDSSLIVYILPGYTDTTASTNLGQALSSNFPGRVFMMPAKPKPSLLDVTAFIDQADIFVTGDTGLMHLAVVTKKILDDDDQKLLPRNSVKIIVLFGGTNPSFYGYRNRTVILGKGRKEQRAFRPGITKESYNPKGRVFFDHIAPEQLTEAIIS